MLKKNFSNDKAIQHPRNDTLPFTKDIKNLYPHKRTTAKKQKPKPSYCPESLNPEMKDSSIAQYLKSKAIPNNGEIKNSNLTDQMRILVVNWLVEISHKLKMKPETIFHGIHLLDMMLSAEKGITLENLQLLAISCLFVSSKYEEVYPPRVDLYSEVTDYTYSKKKIIDMEAAILANCQFQLTFSTRFTFVTHLCNIKEKRLFNLVLYLLELSLLSLWEDTTQSQIADAALFLANKILKRKCTANKRISKLAWKLMKLWKQHYGGIISYIFDCDNFSFVGGLHLEVL